jgi:hypothetical protein
MIKKMSTLFLILILTGGLLTACSKNPIEETKAPQVSADADEPPIADPETPPPDVESGANPEAYPVDAPTSAPEESVELAYPINEEDINLLIGSWVLVSYEENGNAVTPTEKRLTFAADGSYEYLKEGETLTGTWETNLTASQAALYMDPILDDIPLIVIVEITEDTLHLSYNIGGIPFDEIYQPAK